MRARMLRGTHHSAGVNEGVGATGVAGGSRGSRAEGEGLRPAVDRTAVGAQYTQVLSRVESTHTVVPEKRSKEKELVVDVGRRVCLVHCSIPPQGRERNEEVVEAERLPLS